MATITQLHMTKYFRVIKDNPLWSIGAIISNQRNKMQYYPISDVWLKVEEVNAEFLSAPIIETQPDFFERVYKSENEKMVFLTKDAMIKTYEKFVK